jgi:hypothetical protein
MDLLGVDFTKDSLNLRDTFCHSPIMQNQNHTSFGKSVLKLKIYSYSKQLRTQSAPAMDL